MPSFNSFLGDLAALTRRRRDDAGKRNSLFESVSPGNVGNVFDIQPAEARFADTYSTNAYGTPVRVLDIAGDDALGEMVTVSIQQERIIDDAFGIASTPNVTFFDSCEGPLVGIVEFAAGAGLSTFEFDIPSPVFSPGLVSVKNPASTPATNFSDGLFPWRRVNGVMLSLPASAMRVLIRNDARAPYLIQGGGQVGGDNPSVPGGPARSLNPGNVNPAKVRVHATYGRRPFPMTLTRTIPVCFHLQNDGNGGPTNALSVVALNDNQIDMMIPAYAKKVYVERQPLEATTVAVTFAHSALKTAGALQAPNFHGQFVLPVGDEGPLDIGPLDTIMRIVNPGPSAINNMTLVFELGI